MEEKNTVVAVYVRFEFVDKLFNRLSAWPNREEAAASMEAKLPGARIAEDIPEKLPPVLPEEAFRGLKHWEVATLEKTAVKASEPKKKRRGEICKRQSTLQKNWVTPGPTISEPAASGPARKKRL